MNAARRTMLSVFTVAGLSGALLAPTVATQRHDPADVTTTMLVGLGTPPGSDQREIRTHQQHLLLASDNAGILAAQPVAAVPAAVPTTAPVRASRSRSVTAGAPAPTPRQYARTLLAELGQAEEFGCLSQLWDRESGWTVTASNRTSGAYGIPQALPGSKMSGAGADWRTNPLTQVRWGVGYIADRYGDPCQALAHSGSYGWY